MPITSDCYPSYWRCAGLNTSSGVTITPTELESLHGITVTASQLNYATSFPASAAYSVSAGYAASAGQLGLITAMWRDYIVGGLSLLGGASAPNLTGLTGNLFIYSFAGTGAAQERLYGTMELQHDYKEGQDVRPHIHWTPLEAQTGDVVWQLEYSYAVPTSGGLPGVFTTSVTALCTGSVTASTLSNSHQKKEWSAIPGTGLTIGTVFSFRLLRNPGDAADTYSARAGLVQIGLHYPVSSVGSIYVFGNTTAT